MENEPFLIRVDRLMLAIRWIYWAGRYGHDWPQTRENPHGFAGRAGTWEVAKRYDLGIPHAPGRMTKDMDVEFWHQTLSLLEPNPDLHQMEIDISGLIQETQVHGGSRKHFPAFLRFLRAVAAGEVTEADLVEKKRSKTVPPPPDDGHGQVGPGM